MQIGRQRRLVSSEQRVPLAQSVSAVQPILQAVPLGAHVRLPSHGTPVPAHAPLPSQLLAVIVEPTQVVLQSVPVVPAGATLHAPFWSQVLSWPQVVPDATQMPLGSVRPSQAIRGSQRRKPSYGLVVRPRRLEEGRPCFATRGKAWPRQSSWDMNDRDVDDRRHCSSQRV